MEVAKSLTKSYSPRFSFVSMLGCFYFARIWRDVALRQVDTPAE